MIALMFQQRVWLRLLGFLACLGWMMFERSNLQVLAFQSLAESASETRHVVVGNSAAANGWATNYPRQRKILQMAGRLWVFYSDGVDGRFSSSADGETFSESELLVEGGHFGHRFCVTSQGDSLHLALCTADRGAPVWYRRGRCDSEGRIDWEGPLQQVYRTPDNRNVMYPKVVVDQEGFPYISFTQIDYQVPNRPPYDAIVIKSSQRNGQWKTEQGYPFFLVKGKGSEGYPDPVPVALSDGSVYWIYNTTVQDKDVYLGRQLRDGQWMEPERIPGPASCYAFFSAVAEGRRVHLSFGAGTLYYYVRDPSGMWQDVETLAQSASGHSSISIIKEGIAGAWVDPQQRSLNYRLRRNGNWSDVHLVRQSMTQLPADINLNTLSDSTGWGRLVAMQTEGSAVPFEVVLSLVE